jgi:uncharacterized membrane protein
MSYTTFMDYVTRAFELVGVAVLVVGFAAGFVGALVARLRSGTSEGVYVMIRSYFGRSILLGLIVLIRTFLSFSLEIEIEGVVPRRRWRLSTPGAPREQAAPPAQRSEEVPRG